MKSQIFVRSTAKLSQDVAEKDVKISEKKIEELLNDEKTEKECERIQETATEHK